MSDYLMETNQKEKQEHQSSIGKKILKAGLLAFGIIFLLLCILIFGVLRVPYVQEKVTGYAVNFLEQKIGSEVRIDEIALSFPTSLVLGGVYLEDQTGDTLLYVKDLAIDVDFETIFYESIHINDVELDGLTAKVRQSADSVFNFDYIVNAFASEASAPDTTSTAVPPIIIEDISLKNIYLLYDDQASGDFAEVKLGEFKTEIDEINLNTNDYRIGDSKLVDTDLVYRMRKATETPASEVVSEDTVSSEPLDYRINLESVGLENVKALYEDLPGGNEANLVVGEFNVEEILVDLLNQKVNIEQVSLIETKAGYAIKDLGAPKDSLEVQDEPSAVDESETGLVMGWKVDVGNVLLKDNTLRFDDFHDEPVAEGMDFSHLLVQQFGVELQNLVVRDELIAVDWVSGNFVEKSGFKLKKLKGLIEIKPEEGLKAQNLVMATGNSYLKNQLSLNFPSLLRIADELDKVGFSYALDSMLLSPKDALYFSPELKTDPYFTKLKGWNITGNGRVKGKVNNFNIEKLTVREQRNILMQASGNIKGLPEVDSLLMDISVDTMYADLNRVYGILPDTLFPEGMTFPKRLNAKATYKGTLENLVATVDATTDMGDVSLNAFMKPGEQYGGEAKVSHLEVGNILNDTTIGNLTAVVIAEGVGFDPENNLNVDFDLRVIDAEYNHYHYKDLLLKGEADRMAVKAISSIDGDGLEYKIAADADFNKEVPTIMLKGILGKAHFKELGFMEDTIAVSTELDMNIVGVELSNMKADVQLKDISLLKGTKKYSINTIDFEGHLDSTSAHGVLNSDIIKGNFESNIPMDTLLTMVTARFENYFSINDSVEVEIEEIKGANFHFSIKPVNLSLLTSGLVPGLESITFSGIEGEYDEERDALYLSTVMPNMVYQDVTVDSLKVRIKADSKSLKFFSKVEKVTVPELMVLKNFGVFGKVANDKIDFNILGLSDTKEKWLDIGGQLTSQENHYAFNLKDTLIINYDPWIADSNNQIILGDGLPFFKDFKIGHNGMSLAVASQTSGQDTTIVANIDNLDFTHLTKITEKDTSYVNGNLNLSLKYEDDGALDAKLLFKDMGVMNNLFGDLNLSASNKSRVSKYDFDMSMEGPVGAFALNGNYNLDNEEVPLNLSLDIDKFLFDPFAYFAKDYLSDLRGGIEGELDVKGLGTAPLSVRGEVNTLEPKFKIKMTGSRFEVEGGEIAFIEKGIKIDDFDLVDTNGNKASLYGFILTKDYADFQFDLNILADKFELINSEPEKGQEIYGLLVVDNTTKIKGTLDHLDIKSNVNIDNTTDLTYVYVDGGVGELDKGEDIVTFITMDSLDIDSTYQSNTTYSQLELESRVNIESGTKMTVVMDPQAGDALELTGSGELNINMDPGGDMTMTGEYIIEDGYYGLTFYRVVPKKEFTMRSGSRIYWTGDPYEPLADISAIYTVKTPPYPLVANLVRNDDVNYRKRKTFQVYLNLNGEVMNPEISFELKYPEDINGRDVNIEKALAELNDDPSTLNKQVFSLLMVGGFVDMTGSGGTEGAEIVRGTLSSMITNQLNNLSSEYIKGVDLNFNLDSYDQGNNAGTTTDVGVEVKKQLNDRISVTVGGTYSVESESGAEASAAANTSGFTTDFELEYKIMRDGTLRTKLFSENDKEYFTPQVIKTGVSIIYDRQYNQFRELFIRNIEKKKDRRREIGRIKRTEQGTRSRRAPAKTNSAVDSLKNSNTGAPDKTEHSGGDSFENLPDKDPVENTPENNSSGQSPAMHGNGEYEPREEEE
ncbi:translocation/assembly module TamB domain-containing protein [Limibacter armeniacum]|uniref:translocation/assembly module TamB domain-containing protein n=1 Tax=Limibacter armeniacum TaxID=466084 RepID=UPI002FE65A82